MQITIQIDGPLTDEDRAIFRALAGPAPDWPASVVPKADESIILDHGKAVLKEPFPTDPNSLPTFEALAQAKIEAYRGATEEEREAEVEERPKRRTRRTKAEMEAARAETKAPEPEQAESVAESAPEPEAVSEAPETEAEIEATIKRNGLTEEDVAALRKTIVAQATEMVTSGIEGRGKVKAALESVGAQRVSTLTDEQLPGFADALAA